MRLPANPHVCDLNKKQLIWSLEGKYIHVAGAYRRVIQGKIMVIDPITNHPNILLLEDYQLDQLRDWAVNAQTFIHPL
jgi:hypothetical protein